MPSKDPNAKKKTVQEKGLGVLCPEAQADGVPCCELGRDCDTCEMADDGSEDTPDQAPDSP